MGRSAELEGALAGRHAVGDALAGGVTPKLILLFCSPAYDIDEVLSGVAEVAGDAPLIGCSTAGEIGTDGPGEHGVVALALGGAGFTASTRAATDAADDLRAAGADVAQCMDHIGDRRYRTLILLTDGLAGDQQEVVRGAYGVLGATVPLVGGCAGDDLEMQRTVVMHGRERLDDAVVAAALGSDAPFGIGVRHGWRKVGEPMLVTGSSSNRVETLNDQPALDVYLRQLGAPPEVADDASSLARFAQTHPLGLSRRSGEEVRFVAGADLEDRSLSCIAEVPQGALVWIMEGDAQSVLDATDSACTAALAPLEGRPPVAMVAFDCIARRGVLGETGIRREIKRIAAQSAGAPVAGFYTYGEIARTHGTGGFHNQTLVVLALG